MPRSTSTDLADLACPICEKQFVDRKKRDFHVKLIHMNAGNFKCIKCPKTFSSNKPLTIHLRSHRRKKPFCCRICQKRFKTKHGATLHHLDFHSEKKFKCHICKLSFGRELRLRSHLVRHSNDRPFDCDLCAKKFKRRYNLKRHLSLCRTTRPRVSANRPSVQSKKPVRVVERPDGRSGSNRANYSLRARGKRPNYRVDQEDVDDESDESSESGSPGNSETDDDFQDNESQQSSEPEEGSGPKSDGPVECEGLPYEEERNGDQDEVNWSVERNKSGLPEDHKVTISSSDDDREDEMSVNGSTGAKLKMIFDVQYVAPE